MMRSVLHSMLLLFTHLIMSSVTDSLEGSHSKHINNSNIYTAHNYDGDHGETIKTYILWSKQKV